MKCVVVMDMEADNLEQMNLDLNLEVGAEDIVVAKKQRKKSFSGLTHGNITFFWRNSTTFLTPLTLQGASLQLPSNTS